MNMKLTYFNGRGLAEVSRLIFAATEAKYEDFRYPITVLDWTTYNMVRKEFDADKASGKLWESMDKLPVLEVDGQIICQSKAIERYLASTFGLMGTNVLEAAKIDSLCECIRDFKDMYQKVRNVNGCVEDKEIAINKWFTETLVERLGAFNNLLALGVYPDKGRDDDDVYAVGNRLSLADIVIYSFLVDFFDDKAAIKKSYASYRTLNAIVRTVDNNEGIKKWMAERPDTPF
jgi:glutathione S-transferase